MTTSAIQALAMGLPCITTDHSGFREQIIDGKNGFVAREADVEDIAEKLLYAIEHPELWPALGKHGRAYMKAHYDNEVLINRQVEIYTSVVATK